MTFGEGRLVFYIDAHRAVIVRSLSSFTETNNSFGFPLWKRP